MRTGAARAQRRPGSRRGRGRALRAFGTLALLAMALGLVGCGKKGPPVAPPGVPDVYPRSYPRE